MIRRYKFIESINYFYHYILKLSWRIIKCNLIMFYGTFIELADIYLCGWYSCILFMIIWYYVRFSTLNGLNTLTKCFASVYITSDWCFVTFVGWFYKASFHSHTEIRSTICNTYYTVELVIWFYGKMTVIHHLFWSSLHMWMPKRY